MKIEEMKPADAYKALQEAPWIGRACLEAGITNPEAIPKMVEFVKENSHHTGRCQSMNMTGPVLGKFTPQCFCVADKAEAILKEAGVME
jgi:hypothetical protein